MHETMGEGHSLMLKHAWTVSGGHVGSMSLGGCTQDYPHGTRA